MNEFREDFSREGYLYAIIVNMKLIKTSQDNTRSTFNKNNINHMNNTLQNMTQQPKGLELVLLIVAEALSHKTDNV